jgi:hypothetical protein
LETAEQRADDVSALAEERQFIERRQIEVVLHVEIRRAALGAVVLRVGLIRGEAGTFVRELVNALAEAIVRLHLETAGEAAHEIGVERVVI